MGGEEPRHARARKRALHRHAHGEGVEGAEGGGLAARREGVEILLAETVVLYHLERQSQSLVSSDRWKEELTYYNCWHHTVKWDADIRQLASGSPS